MAAEGEDEEAGAVGPVEEAVQAATKATAAIRQGVCISFATHVAYWHALLPRDGHRIDMPG